MCECATPCLTVCVCVRYSDFGVVYGVVYLDKSSQLQAAADAQLYACLKAQGVAATILFIPYQLRAADLTMATPSLNALFNANISFFEVRAGSCFCSCAARVWHCAVCTF